MFILTFLFKEAEKSVSFILKLLLFNTDNIYIYIYIYNIYIYTNSAY